jgi:hypothetical protein
MVLFWCVVFSLRFKRPQVAKWPASRKTRRACWSRKFWFMLSHSLFLRIQFRYRRLSFYSQIILNRAKQDFSLRMGGCLLPTLHSLSHV